MEVSFGVARIQYGPVRKGFLDPGLFSFYSQGRLFYEMNLWPGQLITGYKVSDMEVPGWEEKFYNLNAGFNWVIPRGLVWFGLDGFYLNEKVGTWYKGGEGDDSYLIYREPGSLEEYSDDEADRFGGIISFGIERNIWGRWLKMRVGGQKSFVYNTCTNNSGSETICTAPQGKKGNYWSTNPGGDGSLDDHVGVGVGFSVENKLKIDLTLAEDAFFRNPFLGSGRFISRISAVYTF
jgi:hypothetical protein